VAPRSELAERKTHVSALGVVAPPPIYIQTPVFEGALATLFACVRERKIELNEIPLHPVCEAYFQYLIQSNLDAMDEAAAALAALAFLLERKAWGLLPTPEPEPEIEGDTPLLPPSIHEYDELIGALRVWHQERSRLHFRTTEALPAGYELPIQLEDVSVMDLARAFEALLRRIHPEPYRPPHGPRPDLGEVMASLLRNLGPNPKSMRDVFPERLVRSDAVFWFLGLLELIRLAQVRVHRSEDDLLFARSG
jgi:chromatin segregation and condensation protein Rec8/ScpA/Scc1 (kleisin family)